MTKTNTTPVRIDQDLYDFFVDYAKQEGRSVTQQINYLLRQAVRAAGLAEAADKKYNTDTSQD